MIKVHHHLHCPRTAGPTGGEAQWKTWTQAGCHHPHQLCFEDCPMSGGLKTPIRSATPKLGRRLDISLPMGTRSGRPSTATLDWQEQQCQTLFLGIDAFWYTPTDLMWRLMSIPRLEVHRVGNTCVENFSNYGVILSHIVYLVLSHMIRPIWPILTHTLLLPTFNWDRVKICSTWELVGFSTTPWMNQEVISRASPLLSSSERV